jgi:hypothetical protein
LRQRVPVALACQMEAVVSSRQRPIWRLALDDRRQSVLVVGEPGADKARACLRRLPNRLGRWAGLRIGACQP